MKIAQTKCTVCNKIIDLDSKYGFTEKDNGRKFLLCDECCGEENEESEDNDGN